VISEPQELVASVTASIIACSGGTATVVVSATGGTPDYTGTGTFYVSTAGTYTYTVTDAHGCTDVVSVEVTQEVCATQCETAYAKAASGAICFLNDPTVPNARWGWTNPISPENSYTFNLYAGAAGCVASEDKLAGTVKVDYFGGTVTVTYNVVAPWVMSEAHLYVGKAKYPTKGGKITVAPGQYPYNVTLDKATTYTFTIKNQSGNLYVIAHAVTCKPVTSTTTLVATTKGAPITTGLEARAVKAYPNPFSDKVTFEFVSDKDAHAVLEITNMLGQKIATLLNASVKEGVMNRVEFTPANVAPGILIYRLLLDGNTQTGRIVYKK
jgi:hypothetical protein